MATITLTSASLLNANTGNLRRLEVVGKLTGQTAADANRFFIMRYELVPKLGSGGQPLAAFLPLGVIIGSGSGDLTFRHVLDLPNGRYEQIIALRGTGAENIVSVKLIPTFYPTGFFTSHTEETPWDLTHDFRAPVHP